MLSIVKNTVNPFKNDNNMFGNFFATLFYLLLCLICKGCERWR